MDPDPTSTRVNFVLRAHIFLMPKKPSKKKNASSRTSSSSRTASTRRFSPASTTVAITGLPRAEIKQELFAFKDREYNDTWSQVPIQLNWITGGTLINHRKGNVVKLLDLDVALSFVNSKTAAAGDTPQQFVRVIIFKWINSTVEPFNGNILASTDFATVGDHLGFPHDIVGARNYSIMYDRTLKFPVLPYNSNSNFYPSSTIKLNKKFRLNEIISYQGASTPGESDIRYFATFCSSSFGFPTTQKVSCVVNMKFIDM